jgi:hypothetical protein
MSISSLCRKVQRCVNSIGEGQHSEDSSPSPLNSLHYDGLYASLGLHMLIKRLAEFAVLIRDTCPCQMLPS